MREKAGSASFLLRFSDGVHACRLGPDRLEKGKAITEHEALGNRPAPRKQSERVVWDGAKLVTLEEGKEVYHYVPPAPTTYLAPLRRLVGAWTAARVDYSGREYGFQLALWYDIKEVLPAARETVAAKVKDDPYPGNTARNVGFALLMVGKFGSKDDLPLLEKHAAGDVRCAVFLHDPPPKAGEPVLRLIRSPIDGQHTTTQLRDVSAAMRLHLLGQNPDDFSFYRRWPNDPDARKLVKPAERSELYSIGFVRDADRVAAHKKAKVWLDKQVKQDEPKR